LENEIARLLAQPQLRATMAAQAKEAITIHRGATERAATLLLQLRSRRA
jgi:hypothetical protein